MNTNTKNSNNFFFEESKNSYMAINIALNWVAERKSIIPKMGWLEMGGGRTSKAVQVV